MKETESIDRLAFLAQEFDVFNCTSESGGENLLEKKLENLRLKGYNSIPIVTHDNIVIAILSKKLNEKKRMLKTISICDDVFAAMIGADPTPNKTCLQWMLTIFSKLIKEEDIQSTEAAIRFVKEDLPQANLYLQLFEDNKRKKKFMELAKANETYILRNITDPTNINQYKSLGQLFDFVDPFIEKEPSAVERTLDKYVKLGQAIIPVKDRKFTLYIPKSVEASIVFANFANWCTARPDNSNFEHYRNSYKKPNGEKSDIYIIINNKFFEGESDEIYQIHFETRQLKDKKNQQNVSIFESVISESDGIKNFFYDELMKMAKGSKKGLDDNVYLEYLIEFGFTESLFELIDENDKNIKFMDKASTGVHKTFDIPALPDLSKFKNLDQFVIVERNLVDIHPSIGNLTKLELLALPNNNIKTLPSEIGNLKNLVFLNLMGNKITNFPNEITKLDKTNGGSLYRLAIKESDIGAENYNKLKKLLPTTQISEK